MTTNVWARHAPATSYCLVKSVDDSSARTFCHGAWNVTDSVELHNDPPVDMRCGACVSNATVLFDAVMDGDE